jgi:hypothetical protein
VTAAAAGTRPVNRVVRGRLDVVLAALGVLALVLADPPVHVDLPLDVVGGAALGLAVGGAVRLAVGHPR